MKKVILAVFAIVVLISAVSVTASGNEVDFLQSLDLFKLKIADIDKRLDENIDNPEEYQAAIDESLEIFADPEYEKIAAEMQKEQANSKAYVLAYLADGKCAVLDCRNGYDPSVEEDAKALQIIEEQVALYEKLEKIVDESDEASMGALFEEIKHFTQEMEPGETIPDLPAVLRECQ